MKVFMFPGQGSQTVGMAKEFYDNFDVAKKVFEEINDVLNKDLTKIIFEGPEEELTKTSNAQPAIMTASIAILRVLEKESGKKINELCDFVAGHSLGEYTALCACESLSLRDTAKLLMVRGNAFANAGQSNPGSMAAIIGASLEQVEELISKARLNNEVLCVANDNVIGQIVISGNVNSIDNAIKVAQEMGIKKAMKLNVAGAFHSPLMEPAIKDVKELLETITVNEPKVGILANYTADVENTNNIKENLINQIVNGVRWRETLDNLISKGVDNFVEVGNGVVLSKMSARAFPDKTSLSINSIESLNNYLESIK